ncbi:hypothetical protein HRR80_004908 [Exophiala dermatitidis]|uniref:Ribokinase n=1 Tax=Exophiala dermatitidis TaxID=5970 RepID=A0AAN6ET96_EXODE|nr:hypothetical protein HRR73_006122 [Exophiala dermatitidis]KAJ4521280.1 hypothetical protein HRR74_003103 [Exophiala dermatitidis]KAJ4541943.1 hypothetical protein HRR77_005838 [Exophiala dermatitidis]KAJ4544709.1 hypothetical protein HRR76_002756 [Exophiala dermatitidis]KAJ4565185.1 hypothetical protein HRR79_005457 [Exophiala dermatitidis]
MATRKPVIRVVGSLNIDFVTRTPRVPGPGETLQATSMTVHAGGKGANQAVACGKAAFISSSHQDVTVEMIGAVGHGDPYYATLLKPTLEAGGVSTTGVAEIEGVQTGTATIIVDEGSNGENRILVVPGANHRVVTDDGNEQQAQNGKQLVLSSSDDNDPDVVVMQGEIPRSTVLALLHRFNNNSASLGQRKSKTCVVFNPAPVFPDGIPIDALRGLAVLVVNETECLLLFKVVQELAATVDDVPASEQDLDEAHLDRLTGKLHDLAAISVVVVTLGSRGVYYSSSTTATTTTATHGSQGKCAALHESANPSNISDALIETRQQETQRGLVPAVKVPKVVDTTAAGDTFVGYLATALARHVSGGSPNDSGNDLASFDVQSAVTRANQAAAKCVQRDGAMESIPFGYEL